MTAPQPTHAIPRVDDTKPKSEPTWEGLYAQLLERHQRMHRAEARIDDLERELAELRTSISDVADDLLGTQDVSPPGELLARIARSHFDQRQRIATLSSARQPDRERDACRECNGCGGRSDPVATDQWYSCDACAGSGSEAARERISDLESARHEALDEVANERNELRERLATASRELVELRERAEGAEQKLSHIEEFASTMSPGSCGWGETARAIITGSPSASTTPAEQPEPDRAKVTLPRKQVPPFTPGEPDCKPITEEAYFAVKAVTTQDEQPGRAGECAAEVTCDEAEAILQRFINSHWRDRGNGKLEQARFSIPADLKRDDDCRMQAFIDRQRALLAKIEREAYVLEGQYGLDGAPIAKRLLTIVKEPTP